MINPTTLLAADVGINKKDISDNALKVVRDLQEAGYKAYLVGGCVRDLILDLKPKDFDVVTNATPEQIKKVINKSRIIGRRFRLVHVRFGYEVIEVATFRADADDRDKVDSNEMSEGDQGQLLRDNVYGTIEEDVMRRDFKANALYYDPINGDILDFVDGLTDIKERKLCSIGEPKQRFREDPVRMLRVIRFAAKLGFEMEQEALEMIEDEGKLLSHVSSARLFDEVLKLFHGGAAYDTYLLLRKYGIFKYLFPFTDQCIVEGVDGMPERALQNTDKRVRQGKPVIPAFLFACMMWDPVKADAQILMSDGTPEKEAWRIAMNDGLRDQHQYVAVPRRLAEIILDIWGIHFRLVQRNPRMIKSNLNNRRFRAAYDFLLLRTALHEVDEEVAEWWTEIQDADDQQKSEMISEVGQTYKSGRQNRHADGEKNGNSIDYNLAEPNYNQAQPTSKPRNNKRRANGRSGQGQGKKKRGRRASKASGGKRYSGAQNGNPNNNGSRRNSKKRPNNRRRAPQQGQSSSSQPAEGYYADAKPKDEYGNHQASNANKKKVKVRRKRKVAGGPNSNDSDTPVF